MRRFSLRRFNTKLSRLAVLVILVTIIIVLCIAGPHLWTVKTWTEIKRVFKGSPRNISILELMGTDNAMEVVMPDVRTLLMEPTNPYLKHSLLDRRRPFAVVLVVSTVNSFSQRHAIRSTWYKWADNLNIRVFFMIGYQSNYASQNKTYELLEEEQRRHDDLIVDDFEEGYYKLPGKILRMFKWYNSSYIDQTEPRFLIKTDQDVFVNLPNIVAAIKNTSYYYALMSQTGCIEQLNSNEYDFNSGYTETCVLSDELNVAPYSHILNSYFIGGYKFKNAHLELDPNSKWYLDTKERKQLDWSNFFLPHYANGPCYVISGNLVKPIYQQSLKVPMYPFEDVYIVGILSHYYLSLEITHMEEMHLNKKFLCHVRKRAKLEKMVAMHPVEHPSLMWKLCRKIRSCNNVAFCNSVESISQTSFIMTLSTLSGVYFASNYLFV